MALYYPFRLNTTMYLVLRNGNFLYHRALVVYRVSPKPTTFRNGNK